MSDGGAGPKPHQRGVTHRTRYPRDLAAGRRQALGELAGRSGESASAEARSGAAGGRRKSRSGARAPQRPAEVGPGAAARARKKTRLEGRAESGRAVVRLRQPNRWRPRLGPPTLLPPLARDVSREAGPSGHPARGRGCCGEAAQANGAPPAHRRVSTPASESLLPGWLTALSRVFSSSASGWFRPKPAPVLAFQHESSSQVIFQLPFKENSSLDSLPFLWREILPSKDTLLLQA